MKVKRVKKASRVMSFFCVNFGHRAPYQLLLDGTFCQACLVMKVNIREQLPKYLGEVKLLTTPCCIQETEALGPELYGATTILKQFALHKCGHDKERKPAAKCIKAMLGESNENRYIVASQDAMLRDRARRVPGTPVLYLHSSAPTLEKPSEESQAKARKKVDARIDDAVHSRVLDELKKKEFGDQSSEVVHRRKRKGGPNPLSCMKSKKGKTSNTKSTNHQQEEVKANKAKKKRRRPRKKDGNDAKA